MATSKSFSGLSSSLASFNDMIKRFGVVTVMDVKVYDVLDEDITGLKANEIIGKYTSKPLCILDTLKVTNVTEDGPDKTVTGGKFNNPLIKFGKSARLEMQDALGNAEALQAIGGAVVESFGSSKDIEKGASNVIVHFSEDFGGPKTLIGESFFIDQRTGSQVPVKVIFYQFLPDSLTNLSMDAEGDATVFDLNGDLLATTITIGTDGTDGGDLKKGVFYSIIPDNFAATTDVTLENVKLADTITTDYENETALDGVKDDLAIGKVYVTKDGKKYFLGLTSGARTLTEVVGA